MRAAIGKKKASCAAAIFPKVSRGIASQGQRNAGRGISQGMVAQDRAGALQAAHL